MKRTGEAILLGIPNCDTVRKARAWMDAAGHPYRFHDFREQPVERARIEGWITRLGEAKVLNRSSTSFRSLAEADKAAATGTRLVDLILQHPTLVRRPVLEAGDVLLTGFKPEAWAEALGSHASE
jgi:arsenate reductase (glutaredoxin)